MADRILIVEDEATLRHNLGRYLERAGYFVTCCESAEAAREAVEAGDAGYDVALIDVRLPGEDGLSLASWLQYRAAETMVLVMTAYGSLESVIEAMRIGVQDYLVKPVLLEDVHRKIKLLVEQRRLVRDNVTLRRRLSQAGLKEGPFAGIVASSKPMKSLLAYIGQIAASPATVLIEGESGSGKEVIAHAVHDASPRADAPFVAVNVTAIPEQLVESYLFGHQKGAFTGAEGSREGLFRAASGGTLFLDEIGDLPLAIQAKLLRVLETKEVLAVGADRAVKVSTRIVVATHRDLRALIAEGRFRHDLYYRLDVIRLRVPPLRERPDDIPLLAHHFLQRHCRDFDKRIESIDSAALRRLGAYGWPGNVRELSNVIERAVAVCQVNVVGVGDLPVELFGRALPAGDTGNYQSAMANFERELLESTLDRVGGDRREAARVLGVSLATLYRRLDRLGLGGSRRHDGAVARGDDASDAEQGSIP